VVDEVVLLEVQAVIYRVYNLIYLLNNAIRESSSVGIPTIDTVVAKLIPHKEDTTLSGNVLVTADDLVATIGEEGVVYKDISHNILNSPEATLGVDAATGVQ
jgi:hypothetical protein